MICGSWWRRIFLATLSIFVLTAFLVAWWRTAGQFSLSTADAYVLVGGVTDTSASFRIGHESGAVASLAIYAKATDGEGEEEESLKDRVFTIDLDEESDDEDAMVVSSVPVPTGTLTAKTRYFYRVVVTSRKAATTTSSNETAVAANDDDATTITLEGSFRTSVPDGTRFNFTIAAAGCAWTGSRSALFERLLAYSLQEDDDTAPLQFVLQLGDFHYGDIGVADMQVRTSAVAKTLGSPEQAAFYRNTPLVYVWDDHDWLGNNAGATSEREPGAADTAKASYRRLFPHHRLYHGDDDNNNLTAAAANDTTTTTTSGNTGTNTTKAIYHAFTVGTVRFVLSDLRSESMVGHIFSSEQGAWLQNEFAMADQYDYVIWVTSKPWIGSAQVGEDAWFGNAADRAQVSDWINNHTNILAISADAHMLAFDDGSNTNYGMSSLSSHSFPILQSGPMDNVGSVKGGPYTSGCHGYSRERNSQFSIVRFEFTTAEDGESKSCIYIRGYRVVNGGDDDDLLVLDETLCGPDITMPASATPVGSCEIPRFRRSSSTLLALSVVVTIIGLGVGVCLLRDCYASFLIFVAYAATFAVGIATPFARGVKTLDVRPTFTILFVQSTIVLILLLVHWRGKSGPRTRTVEMAEKNDDKAEEKAEDEEESEDNKGNTAT